VKLFGSNLFITVIYIYSGYITLAPTSLDSTPGICLLHIENTYPLYSVGNAIPLLQELQQELPTVTSFAFRFYGASFTHFGCTDRLSSGDGIRWLMD